MPSACPRTGPPVLKPKVSALRRPLLLAFYLFSVACIAAGCGVAGQPAATDPPPPGAPVIIQQPVSQSIVVGSAATFSVMASGTGPFTYQWQRSSGGTIVNIPGATSSSVVIATSSADAGTVSAVDVIVSNAAGSATSNVVALTVTGSTAQTIAFGALPNVTYGAAPIGLTATASSGLAVSYGVTGPATIAGSTLTITGAGTVTVTATQAGNTNFAPATPVPQTFTVSKAQLTVAATNASMLFGQSVPSLNYTIAGFVNGDAQSVVTGTPSETTTATSSSPVGNYPITIAAGTLTAANYAFAFVNGTLTVGVASQTITFGALPDVTYGAAPITLGGTASSGLAVSYGVTGPATIAGTTLTITGAGAVTVTATQAGNGNYTAATPVPQTFNVNKASLAVKATDASMVFGQSVPTLAYTISGFVNGDTQAVVTGTPTETTTGTSSSPVGTYPITITAGTLTAANYTFTFTNGTLTIAGATQTITFTALANVTYGAAPIGLTATASSGLAVSYGVTGPATIAGSTLTITGAGTVTVTAMQAGNTNYAPATPVPQTFTVSKAQLTVTATNASMLFGQTLPTFTYTIAGFVNGDAQSVVTGAPTETTTATPSSPVGTYPITIGAGTLTAANYTFAFVNGTLTVGVASQTITFGALPDVTYGAAPITLGGTASSGLAVSYGVTGPATIAGTTLTITGAGAVTVTATQAGNGNYTAATPVPQTFNVNKASLAVKATDASMVFGQSVPTLAYTISGFVNGDTQAVVTGTPTETTTGTSSSPVGTYPITIKAGTLTAANYTFTFTNGTLTIAGATQTITFTALAKVTYGAAPIGLTATASSGLAVSYGVTGPATIAGSTLTITGAGTVTVTAMQAGNTNYAPATPVPQTFTVSKAQLTVAATNASMLFGQTLPTFTYTIAGFVNGDAQSVVTGAPSETTTATSSSPVGTYPITIGAGTLTA